MKFFLCLLIILLGGIGVYAQEEEQVLTQAQFDAVYQGSRDSWSLADWKGKSFRKITITSSSLEGRPQTDFSSKYTSEYVSPTESRGAHESSFGDKKSSSEWIRLGDKYYARKDGGDWKEKAAETQPEIAARTVTETKTLSEAVEYKFLGTEKLNNQTARVYVKNVKRKLVGSTDNQESVLSAVTKFWFSEDGVLLKTDFVEERRTGDKTHRTGVTEIFELDAHIKIVAPILSAVQK